jgi:hypothetical protein
MAWGTKGTAATAVLNWTNTVVNFSALVQKQNVEASVTQFQASEYTCGTSTNYGDIINFGHRDSF